MTKNACHIIVEGRVQGVGFRYYTKEKANQLSLKGWVQNLTDGSVEIHAQGESENLNAFIEWCHSGPSSANVKKLDYRESKLEAFSSFEIRR